MAYVLWSRLAHLSRYTAVMLIAIFSGCTASIEAYPERPFDNALPAPPQIDSVRVVREFYQLPEDQRQNYRNKVIAERIAAINISYRLFEEELFHEGTARNIATDWALLGLAGAGATVTSSATQQILAMVSGGLVGARAAFDKNALFDRTLPSLVAKMEASRRHIEERLLNGMKLDISAYGIIEALGDLDSYYTAGTIPGAILNISGDAGVLKAQIQQRRTFSAKSLDDAGKALIPLITGTSGTVDAAKVKQLRSCFGVLGLPADILIVDFLYGGEFVVERAQALACMRAVPAVAAVPITRAPSGPVPSGPSPPGTRRVGSPGNPATALDPEKLTDQLKTILIDPKTGKASEQGFALVRACYPASLKSIQVDELIDKRSGFATEKKMIVDCVETVQLTDQLDALLRDPTTGVKTKERAGLAISCYPPTLSRSRVPEELLLNRTAFSKEKKAIIDCMKRP